MNPLDQIQAQVMTAVNGPCHGRAGNYYVLQTGSAIPCNFIPNMGDFKSVFDTGGAEIDFDVMTGFFSADELTSAPNEMGRGTIGDKFVFTDDSSTWYIRQVAETAIYGGSYYDVIITNYQGPMTGV